METSSPEKRKLEFDLEVAAENRAATKSFELVQEEIKEEKH